MKKATLTIWLLFTIVCPEKGMGENRVFSVRAGWFHFEDNAQKRYGLLKNSLPAEWRRLLRLEKKGASYVIQVGPFTDRETAERVLKEVRAKVSDAYLIHIPSPGERKEKIPSPTEYLPIQSSPGPSGKGKRDDSLNTEKIRVVLTGFVQEAVPVASESLGLAPGKALLRLSLRVEETQAVDRSPNLLKDKEGGILTLFSENPSPLLRPGQRIWAVVEYRGGLTARLFWLISFRPASVSGPASKD